MSIVVHNSRHQNFIFYPLADTNNSSTVALTATTKIEIAQQSVALNGPYKIIR